MSTRLRFETNVFDPDQGSSPIRTLKREFDVNDWEVFSQTEKDVVVFSQEASALLLREAVKKKKRPWLPHPFRRIQRWLRTGDDQSASAA